MREPCLKAEKAVVRSVHSHCVQKVLFRSDHGEDKPVNVLQQKKF